MNELAIHPLTGIELFSGVGMLGEGLRAGLAYLGISYRAVCHVEREAHAASVMVARMAEGSMDATPVWSDVTTFDATAWRGKVDCIVAGFPCQDLSVAGKRAGLDGKRSGLFFEVTRIADDSGAWLILLENVAGIASATATVVDEAEGELDERAASRVVGELADCGWDAEWITLSASDVGASHGRARWFCLAWRVLADTESWRGRERERDELAGRAEAEGAGEQLGNAEGQRSIGTADEQRRTSSFGCSSEQMGNTAGNGWREGRPELQGRSRRSNLGGASLPVADPDIPGRGTGRVIESESSYAESLCIALADTSGQRSQGNEQRPAHEQDGRTEQEPCRSTSEFRDVLLFAPGPNDERWTGIIERHPHLAPALEPTFRGVVNGLAFDMGDSRAARLKCVGNGVVALCAAAAVVELIRRAGIK